MSDTDIPPTENAPQEASHEASAGKGPAQLRMWAKRHQLLLIAPATLLVGLALGSATAAHEPPADGDPHQHGGGHDDTTWTCSMHPQIQLPEEGPCPICGMDLIPLGQGAAQLPPDRVVLSDRGKALARIATAPVRWADTSVELRLQGKLGIDETKVRAITPWIGGRIERLYVSTVGEQIEKGQAIASLYSQEIYTAHQDLISARRQRNRLADALPVAQRAADRALEAAHTRLELLGVSVGETDKLANKRRPMRSVGVVSRYRGRVIEQLVHEGAYVEPGQPLFKVADLDTVWAQLDAYESDLPRISEGQDVALTVSSFPGETFTGKVAFVDPVVHSLRRTARVRVEVPNDEGRLRPGMFVDAVVQAAETEQRDVPLVVPTSAPLFTGTRSLVYVELTGQDDPSYEVREISLGPRAGDVYPVLAGLAEGERVVVRGAFVLDSDLQIRGGQSMMAHEDDAARAERRPMAVPEDFRTGVAPVIERYLELQTALAKDDSSKAKEAFGALGEATTGFDPRSPEAARRVWRPLGRKLLSAARRGTRAEGIDAQRRHFEVASRLVIEAVQRFGNPLREPLRLSFCSMAFDDRGALWLQRAEKIENPYFGSEMYRCGAIRHAVAAGQHLGRHAGQLKAPDRSAPAAAGHQH